MPVLFTYDLEGADPSEHNRLQSMFERLGWENLGGSSYRYPRLGTSDQPVEDWMNHIVPALMLFRVFVLNSASELKKFTLDAQSSSGYNPATGFGCAPLLGSAMKTTKKKAGIKKPKSKSKTILYPPKNPSFAKKKLVDWLDETDYPY